MARYFPESLVREALPMAEAIRAVEAAFAALGAGRAENRPRERLRLPGGRFPARILHIMTAAISDLGLSGLKAYTSGRDGARFSFLLFDQASGALAAVMEADLLGRIRTGAATGVAAAHLAPETASTVGLLGCGAQAGPQLEALAAVRPLERAEVFCRDPGRRRRFAEEMAAQLDLEVVPAGSAEQAVRGKALVVTITSSREPVLCGDWVEPAAFVAAAGSNSRSRRELDAGAVLGRGRIVVDDPEQAKRECGDLLPLVAAGELEWGRVESLASVVAGGTGGAGGARSPAREAAPAGALFESQGVALEDLAVAALVYRRAAAEAPPLGGAPPE